MTESKSLISSSCRWFLFPYATNGEAVQCSSHMKSQSIIPAAMVAVVAINVSTLVVSPVVSSILGLCDRKARFARQRVFFAFGNVSRWRHHYLQFGPTTPVGFWHVVCDASKLPVLLLQDSWSEPEMAIPALFPVSQDRRTGRNGSARIWAEDASSLSTLEYV